MNCGVSWKWKRSRVGQAVITICLIFCCLPCKQQHTSWVEGTMRKYFWSAVTSWSTHPPTAFSFRCSTLTLVLAGSSWTWELFWFASMSCLLSAIYWRHCKGSLQGEKFYPVIIPAFYSVPWWVLTSLLFYDWNSRAREDRAVICLANK